MGCQAGSSGGKGGNLGNLVGGLLGNLDKMGALAMLMISTKMTWIGSRGS